jgi:hypothetical protein
MTESLWISKIADNSRVLFLWHGDQVPEHFQTCINTLRQKVNEQNVSVEHLSRVDLSNYEKSSFNTVLCNVLLVINLLNSFIHLKTKIIN